MRKWLITALAIGAVLVGHHPAHSADHGMEEDMQTKSTMTHEAVFAGGCFWCTEADFEKVDGVLEAISGYTGGQAANPTYEQVSTGTTGHREAVHVVYDPDQISYQGLLDIFWSHIDPADAGGQSADRGPQYTTAIFYRHDEQKQLAQASKAELASSANQEIATKILPASEFYPAEDYH